MKYHGFIVLALMLGLGACAPSSPALDRQSAGALPAAGGTESKPAEPQAASSGFPLTIENCGRTLTFTQPPERVVTTFQSVTEILVALGQVERIVGTQASNFAAPPASIAAEYGRAPLLADHYAERDAIRALKPDFYLAAFYEDVNGIDRLSQTELEASGAQVYLMAEACNAESNGATGVADLYRDILLLGRIFGVEPRAQELVASLQRDIGTVQVRIEDLPPIKAVYVMNQQGAVTLLEGRLPTEILSLSGGVNSFADPPEAGELTRQGIAAVQPEAFIIVDYSRGIGVAKVREWLGTSFATSPAVQRGRIIVIGGEQLMGGIRLADAVTILARDLHPEIFQQLIAAAHQP